MISGSSLEQATSNSSNSSSNCENVLPNYGWMDDSNQIAQKFYMGIAIACIPLIIYGITNINKCLRLYKKTKHRDYLFLNVITLATIIVTFLYYIDGPIRLYLLPDGFMSIQFVQILNRVTITLVYISFSIALYIWAPALFCSFTGKQTGAKCLKILFRIFFAVFSVFVIYREGKMAISFMGDDYCEQILRSITTDKTGTVFLIFIGINDVSVTLCCFLLAVKVRTLFGAQSELKQKLVKILAVIITIGRMVIFFVQLFMRKILDDAEGDANNPDSTSGDQLGWQEHKNKFIQYINEQCDIKSITLLSLLNLYIQIQSSESHLTKRYLHRMYITVGFFLILRFFPLWFLLLNFELDEAQLEIWEYKIELTEQSIDDSYTKLESQEEPSKRESSDRFSTGSLLYAISPTDRLEFLQQRESTKL